MSNQVLRVIGDWNNIPKDLADKHPFPAEGTVVKYRVLQETIVDPNTKRKVWPSVYLIPPISKMKNPDGKGGYINVGMIGSLDRDGNPNDNETLRYLVYPNQMRGVIRLVAGASPETDQIIAYLPYADCNASNPYRNVTKETLFEYINDTAIAIKNRDERKKSMAAWDKAQNLTTPQVERAALLLGFNTIDVTEEVLRDQIEAKAHTDPQGFLEKINDTDGDVIALIKQAVLKGELAIDIQGHALKWGGEGGGIFLNLVQMDLDNASREAAAYLREAKEGSTIIANLRAAVGMEDKKSKSTSGK